MMVRNSIVAKFFCVSELRFTTLRWYMGWLNHRHIANPFFLYRGGRDGILYD